MGPRPLGCDRSRMRLTGPAACTWLRWRLGGLPPLAVVRVPVDGGLQTGLEVRVRGRPTQFGPELRGIDRVSTVVARTVLHPVERVLALSHHLQNHAKHGDVVPLAVRADQVGLADPSLGQDRPHAAGMVLGVDPVAYVLALAVQLRPLASRMFVIWRGMNFSTCWYGP